MQLKRLTLAALVITLVPAGLLAQNASAVVAAASKAMGVDTLNSITYSGTARNGAFGQSKSIGEPHGAGQRDADHAVHPHDQLRTAGRPGRARLAGDRADAAADGAGRAARRCRACSTRTSPARRPSTNWTQALNIWTTPWGFLKGAAANNATVRQQGGQQVVSFSPANLKSPSGQTYTVTGYINNQNLVTKVETRVEHAVVGDLLVEFEYSNYQNMNGVQVPTRIVQRQAGLPTFDADHHRGHAESAEPRRAAHAAATAGRGAPAARRRRGAGRARRRRRRPPAAPPVEKLGEGAFKIGGNYASLAVDMGDHILVVESGQSDARGTGGDGGGQAGDSRTSRSASSSTRIRTSITRAAWRRRWPKARRS